MANYNHSLDLMALIGAQMVNLKVRPRREGESDEEYAKVPVLQYAAVPVAPNDIQVKPDNSEEQFRTFSGQHAYLAFNEYDMRSDNKLVQKTRTRLLQSGTPETPYNVPCRELKPRYRTEFRDAARLRYAAQLKAANPDLANLDDQGASLPRGTERNALTRAIDRKFPYSIGNGYLIESRTPSTGIIPSPVPAASAVGPTEQYAAPSADPFSSDAYADPDSDLPF